LQYYCYIADQLSKITHIRQQMHAIYTKSQIIPTEELSYLFQRKNCHSHDDIVTSECEINTFNLRIQRKKSEMAVTNINT
jgi:arabinogalactan endo-1,4-beta-galactosidase